MPELLYRVSRCGRIIFGIAVLALGGENLLCAQLSAQPFPAQFHAVVLPVIPWLPAAPWIAYATGIALMVCAATLITNVHARAGALLFGAIFVGCDMILHLPRMVVVPQNWGLRGEVCEMLALASAAFIIAGGTTPVEGRAGRWDSKLANAGRVAFGLTAIVFGVDHFLALRLIASLIPAWMPAHLILAGLTGASMVAAGIAIITKWQGGVGAFALGVMFLLFTVVVHVPRVVADRRSPDEWSSALIALGMCGASWICAHATLPERDA